MAGVTLPAFEDKPTHGRSTRTRMCSKYQVARARGLSTTTLGRGLPPTISKYERLLVALVHPKAAVQLSASLGRRPRAQAGHSRSHPNLITSTTHPACRAFAADS